MWGTMFTRLFTKAAVAGAMLLAAQAASAATYDFKAAANSGGGVGESIFSTFSTSASGGVFGGFTGPNLDITASAVDDDPAQFVYFDNNNAGIGVCKDPNSSASVGTYTNGGGNVCDPASDDGITAFLETLTFTATDTAVVIQSIWLNANHDSPDVRDASYMINGVLYDLNDMVTHSLSQTGDVRIDLGFTLGVGESFSLFAVSGSPDSYISGIALAAVPLPAAGLLLLGALGGLGAIGRRRARGVQKARGARGGQKTSRA